MIKTKIKSVMIVTKARDHSLVQLTRELAEWLMTTPRYGRNYGIKVYVDAKLEKSQRFNVDGLRKDNAVVREKDLLRFWTPELCAYADTFDIVLTVLTTLIVRLIDSSVEMELYYIPLGFFNKLFLLLSHSVLDLWAS